MSDDVYRHIPRFYGTVQTDLGDGVVVQLMRDYDGGISRTLRSRLSAADGGGYDYDRRESVAEFCKFLLQNEIIISDMNMSNLLSVRIAPRHERLYAIEGYHYKAKFHLKRWFPPARKAKIRRSIRLLDATIAKFVNVQK